MPVTNVRRRRGVGGHSNSRPDMETEDDADGDVDMDRMGRASEPSLFPEPRTRHLSARAHQAMGIISDSPDNGPLEVNVDVMSEKEKAAAANSLIAKEAHAFFRAFSRCGKEKEKEKLAMPLTLPTSSMATVVGPAAATTLMTSMMRHMNVFSLVERFAF
jgi:hypothetical protein